MKTMITLCLFSLLAWATQAQNNRYEQTMEQYIHTLDTLEKTSTLQDLANKFERVSNAEHEEWLPAYYASYCYINLARRHAQIDKEKIDPLLDQAGTFLATAKDRGADESEVFTLEGYIAQMRIMVDPMTRGQQYGPEAGKKMSMAVAANPDNPRPHLLMGINLLFTPEQFGGGPRQAKPHLEKAVALYEKGPVNPGLEPHWGKGTADYMMKECERMMGE